MMLPFQKRKYKVEIEGRNFLVLWDETPKKYGFHALRHVAARDEAEAEKKALQLLTEEFRAFILNAADDRPLYRISTVALLEPAAFDPHSNQGAEWYLE
jgi:hypothetical protein